MGLGLGLGWEMTEVGFGRRFEKLEVEEAISFFID